MNLETVEELINNYKVKLARLGPALHPQDDMPYPKFVLYNAAKHKKKKYEQRLMVLGVLKSSPKLLGLPDEAIRKMLA